MNLEDIDIIEGNVEADETAYYEALQRAINAADAWKFQGAYGRAMMAAIEAGFCLLGPRPAEDAYGGRIPGREEVQAGSKGSRAYVAARRGEAWANRMERLET
jgi:hypothetical protein